MSTLTARFLLEVAANRWMRGSPNTNQMRLMLFDSTVNITPDSEWDQIGNDHKEMIFHGRTTRYVRKFDEAHGHAVVVFGAYATRQGLGTFDERDNDWTQIGIGWSQGPRIAGVTTLNSPILHTGPDHVHVRVEVHIYLDSSSGS